MKLIEITNKYLTNHDEIKAWLDKMKIENYTIESDGKVSVNGQVNLSKQELTFIPVKFKYVKYDFLCSDNSLTSLNDCVEHVGDLFSCSNNKLKNLKGGPITVNEGYNCSDNQLESLVGAPVKIGGFFNCANNQLETLVGGPTVISGSYSCMGNRLTTVEGCPKNIIGFFNFINNPIKSLIGISDLVDTVAKIYIGQHKITEGGLGLMLIDDLRIIDGYTDEVLLPQFQIIQKYLKNKDRIFECQEELINAGFETYAQL